MITINDGAEATDVVDFVFLEEKFDATGETVGNLAGAADDLRPVVVQIIKRETKCICFLCECLEELSILKQCFGRNTSPV